MYCENCGKKVDKKVKFCRNCGKPIKSVREITDEITGDFKARRYDRIPDKIKSIEDSTDSTFINKAMGDYHFINGEYNEAYSNYSSISDRDRAWDTWLNLGLINLNNSREKEAIACLERINPEKADVSDSLIYEGRYPDTQKLFTDIYLYLGVLYKSAGKKKKAIESFKKVLEYDRDNELVHANLGDIFFKDDEYDEAIIHYERAIKLSQDDMKKSHLHNDLGFAFFRKGSTKEAIESFKNAIILNPDNVNAVHNLGVIYVKSGMQEDVRNDYKEFLKHEGGVDIVFNLSRSIMNVAKQELMSDISIDFIGEDREIKQVKEIIIKAAETDSTVFIQGENGTGKELAARAIHKLSKRADNPFVVVNCAALPETLLESELFGYEKGAFTGAVKEKPGRFEIADTGTVFLDEIGDITPSMQVKLLRFVQEKEFERVGGNTVRKVDVRIITATNRDIKELVENGSFREDLFYRLYVLPVTIPPLRDRGRDIFILAGHFLREFSEKYNKKFRRFTKEALEKLYGYSWPGNVRELENIVERIVTLNDDSEVKEEYLPEEVLKPIPNSRFQIPNEKQGKTDEKDKVIKALQDVNYSKTKAAKELGISRVALWKKMKKLGI